MQQRRGREEKEARHGDSEGLEGVVGVGVAWRSNVVNFVNDEDSGLAMWAIPAVHVARPAGPTIGIVMGENRNHGSVEVVNHELLS